jgi:DNA primase
MDIRQLFKEYRIPIAEIGQPHYRDGWINTECPFCIGNPGNHLGFNIFKGYFHCWRCGGKNTYKTLLELGVPYDVINTQFKWMKFAPIDTVEKKEFRLPSNNKLIDDVRCVTYLKNRKFNPKEIESLWDVRASTITSIIDKVKLKNRLIIPIYWKGEIISYTTRSVLKNIPKKDRYKSCPIARETIPHKNIIYGDSMNWNPFLGVMVEGITDVWRFGKQSFGTFGTAVTDKQLNTIAQNFDKVVIVFDNEKTAYKSAKKIKSELQFRNTLTMIEKLPEGIDDPAKLSNYKANKYIQYINETYDKPTSL